VSDKPNRPVFSIEDAVAKPANLNVSCYFCDFAEGSASILFQASSDWIS
jgi:hypothetical protein